MKNVDWVCPICVDFGKICRNHDKSGLKVGLAQLHEEIKGVRDLNFSLLEENKELNNKIYTLKNVISGLILKLAKCLKVGLDLV